MIEPSRRTDEIIDAELRRTQWDPFFRFHLAHRYASSVFGKGWYASRAEAFEQFFGTPTFLFAQIVVVACWIMANVNGIWSTASFPFILLKLAFSLQASYAEPRIVHAQTRQAERDTVNAIADAAHREHLSELAVQRQAGIASQTGLLARLLAENSALAETVRLLAVQDEGMTADIHRVVFPVQTSATQSDIVPGTTP